MYYQFGARYATRQYVVLLHEGLFEVNEITVQCVLVVHIVTVSLVKDTSLVLADNQDSPMGD